MTVGFGERGAPRTGQAVLQGAYHCSARTCAGFLLAEPQSTADCFRGLSRSFTPLQPPLSFETQPKLWSTERSPGGLHHPSKLWLRKYPCTNSPRTILLFVWESLTRSVGAMQYRNRVAAWVVLEATSRGGPETSTSGDTWPGPGLLQCFSQLRPAGGGTSRSWPFARSYWEGALPPAGSDLPLLTPPPRLPAPPHPRQTWPGSFLHPRWSLADPEGEAVAEWMAGISSWAGDSRSGVHGPGCTGLSPSWLQSRQDQPTPTPPPPSQRDPAWSCL